MSYTLPPHSARSPSGLVYYTADQMHKALAAGAASRDAEVEALRKTTIKECAKVAGDLYAKYRDLYKGRVLPVDKEHWYNPHTDGMADGAGAAEDAILDLLNSVIAAEATK